MEKDIQEFYSELGKTIRYARLKQDLSQEDFAWKCGISTNSLGRIECAKGEIKLCTILKIFEELNLDFNKIQQIYKQSTVKITLQK